MLTFPCKIFWTISSQLLQHHHKGAHISIIIMFMMMTSFLYNTAIINTCTHTFVCMLTHSAHVNENGYCTYLLVFHIIFYVTISVSGRVYNIIMTHGMVCIATYNVNHHHHHHRHHLPHHHYLFWCLPLLQVFLLVSFFSLLQD